MPLVMRSFSAYRRSLRPGRRRCRWLLRERPGGALPPAGRMPRCPTQTPGPFGKNQDLQCRTSLGITIPANRKSLAGQSPVAATPRSAYRRLREEWCEQAEGAGRLDGLGTAARAEF